MEDRTPFPVKPLLVFVAVIAAVRLSLSVPPGRFLSPSLLAAALFLYAPLPRYWRLGFPAWARATDPGRSVAFFALLAGAGAIAFFLFVRLPLPPAISPYRGTVPLTAAMAAHHLLLVALPEEVFFRGYLYDAFEEAGREPVLPVALLFAIGHFVIAPSPFRLLTFFPALLLGWGRKRSGNVYVPTAVHFLYNLFPSVIGGCAVSGIRVTSGHLFFFYAYDAGFEIALEEARALCEASDSPGIAGLRPAPAHLQYRPRPLTVPAEAVPVTVSGKSFALDATMKIFDFGVLSVTLTLPLEDLSLDEYAEIALSLASENGLENSARDMALGLFERIRPAVSRPMFADLVEDYCMWHIGGFSPGGERDGGARPPSAGDRAPADPRTGGTERRGGRRIRPHPDPVLRQRPVPRGVERRLRLRPEVPGHGGGARVPEHPGA